MKIYYLLPTVIHLFFYTHLQGQQFVNTTNKWFADDCYISFSTGDISCSSYSYEFGDIQVFNGHEYRKLITNNNVPSFSLGEFYREENGKVYLKLSPTQDEFLIYDFNLGVGEKTKIGNSVNYYMIEVIDIDSVTLISGEKRKRLKIIQEGFSGSESWWIEGVGSEYSPLNTFYQFALDTWVSFNCFFSGDMVEYSLGNCQLTSTSEIPTPEKFQIFPNPASHFIRLASSGGQRIVFYELSDAYGNCCLQSKGPGTSEIDISDIPPGVFFVKVLFENGQVAGLKFIKN